jgi:ABC-2 type transport system ATP-binding protein
VKRNGNPTQYAVLTEGLRKSFKSKKQAIEAVSGMDLRVRSGEIYSFLGPNGAGKTTTLRMLATLLPIEVGEAFVAGIDLRRQPGTAGVALVT